MISRLWHGWTKRENADAYEELLRRDVKDKEEVEFVTLTIFESIEAVKRFAGEDYEVAVILPEARKLLSRFDARSAHYETVLRIE